MQCLMGPHKDTTEGPGWRARFLSDVAIRASGMSLTSSGHEPPEHDHAVSNTADVRHRVAHAHAWPGAATLAFLLFVLAAVGDWYDGYLARTLGLVTTFGKLMDALADKIMVMGIVIALVDQHRLPVALALITLCREFLITGMRMVAASKGVVVAADSGGKSKTLTQLIALGFFLGGPMLSRDGDRLLHWQSPQVVTFVGNAGLVVFIIATALSVWSGYRYISRNSRLVFGEAGGAA